MSLLDRLIGGSPAIDKIAVHAFYSSLVDSSAGEIVKATIVSEFSMSAADESDLDWLITKHGASANKKDFRDRIHNIFILAESGFPGYTTQAEVVAIINRIP